MSPVPIQARLTAIEIAGEFKAKQQNKHFITLSVDNDRVIAESEKKSVDSLPRWEWKAEAYTFWFHPSSTIRVTIYRLNSLSLKFRVGEFNGRVIELLENATVDLKDKNAQITLKIDLNIISEPDANFMKLMESISSDVSRLDGAFETSPALSALGAVFKFTKTIMDVVADAHPILKASWTVISVVYDAVQEVGELDDDVRDLADNLRELLGIAAPHSDLLVIEGTTNVIEEIGRISLKITSLIHEYTRINFAGRIVKSKISDDFRSRVEECLKTCNDLQRKFTTRILLGVNNVVKNIDGNITKNIAVGANIQEILDMIQNKQLAKEVWQWLSPPDSSRIYNEAQDKYSNEDFAWFFDGSQFNEFRQASSVLWIKGSARSGKTGLCAYVVEKIIKLHEENPSTIYAYFFLGNNDVHKGLHQHDSVVRSLIQQLSLQCDGIPTVLDELYKRHGGRQQPSTSALEDVLNRIINRWHSSVYIIIDSIDRCADREKINPWFDYLVRNNLHNLHMLVTSQGELIDNLELPNLHRLDMPDLEEANTDRFCRLPQVESAVASLGYPVGRISLENGKLEGARANANTPEDKRGTALQIATYQGSIANVERLIEETEDLNTHEGEYGAKYGTGLQIAAFQGHNTLVEMLLDAGADPNIQGGKYGTALQIASYKGNIAVAEMLLEKEADMDAHGGDYGDKYGTALQIASYKGNIAVAEMLLEKEADMDAHGGDYGDKYGTALQIASSQGHNTIVKILVDEGADVNIQGGKYGTALQIASFHGYLAMADMILNNGADVNAYSGDYGQKYGTGLQIAAYYGQNTIVQRLLEHGADANVEGGKNGTALQIAVLQANIAVTDMLLKNGADPNAKGGKYGNALQIATTRGYNTIVKMLLEHGAHPLPT